MSALRRPIGVKKEGGPEKPGTLGAADGLSLAAAPTFALMALISGVGGSDILCSPDASPLTGMAAMYMLMSAFHLAPWLRLISSQRTLRKT